MPRVNAQGRRCRKTFSKVMTKRRIDSPPPLPPPPPPPLPPPPPEEAAAASSCAQASLPNRPGGKDTAGVQWRGIPRGRAARAAGQPTTARPPDACCKAWPGCTPMTGACARRKIMHASASRRADQPHARTPRTPALPPQQLVLGQVQKVALPTRWHGRFPELLRKEVNGCRLRQRANLLQEPAELDEALGVLIRLHRHVFETF